MKECLILKNIIVIIFIRPRNFCKFFLFLILFFKISSQFKSSFTKLALWLWSQNCNVLYFASIILTMFFLPFVLAKWKGFLPYKFSSLYGLIFVCLLSSFFLFYIYISYTIYTIYIVSLIVLKKLECSKQAFHAWIFVHGIIE